VKHTLSSLVVVVALVVVTAGCGGGESQSTLSRNEYEAKVVAAGKSLASQFESISNEAAALSSGELDSLDDADQLFEDLGAVVSKGETELRIFADDLAALAPPDDASDANAALASAFGSLADDFGTLGAALEDGSISDITQLAAKLQAIGSSEAGTAIQSAIEELEKAGYDFDVAG
jgi:hypothetical protein